MRIRRNARARRITLRVSGIDGSPSVTVPPRVPLAEIRLFVEKHRGWLDSRTEALPDGLVVRDGASLPFLGQPHRIVGTDIRRVRREDGVLLAPAGRIAPAVLAFLKTEARNALVPAVDRYAAQIGKPVAGVSLRDTRSRWGSCSAAGRLMFSWRLVMAPPAVIDYVALHEVAHLREMNHSARFWDIVAGVMPDYKTHRDWLRSEGMALHRIDFSA